jgi:AbrB family looped-hinge helix DNA binding protein
VRRHFAGVTTSVDTKGAIVLPAKFRRQDGIKPGETFEVERLARGKYRVVRKEKAAPKKRLKPKKGGFVEWLLACPEKGWFQPMPRGESTDSIKSPFE